MAEERRIVKLGELGTSTGIKPEPGEIRIGWQIGRRKNNGYSRYMWHACVGCGKERWVLIRHKAPGNLRCHKCEARRRPGRERKTDKKGYILVRLPPGLEFFKPMAKENSNYVYEHRLVMARHLSRCLLPWEIVHHRNGIKDDNRLQNLQLLPSSRHLVDIHAVRRLKKLEAQFKEQAKYIRLLQWQVRGLQTVLRGEAVTLSPLEVPHAY